MFLATTTATIVRGDSGGDPYETVATGATIAAGVRAHIARPSVTDQSVGGNQVIVNAVALLPAGTDVASADELVDDGTGQIYRVASVLRRQGLGLDHVRAALVNVAGGSSG